MNWKWWVCYVCGYCELGLFKEVEYELVLVFEFYVVEMDMFVEVVVFS